MKSIVEKISLQKVVQLQFQLLEQVKTALYWEKASFKWCGECSCGLSVTVSEKVTRARQHTPQVCVGSSSSNEDVLP